LKARRSDALSGDVAVENEFGAPQLPLRHHFPMRLSNLRLVGTVDAWGRLCRHADAESCLSAGITPRSAFAGPENHYECWELCAPRNEGDDHDEGAAVEARLRPDDQGDENNA
jgi:hypothetical protein